MKKIILITISTILLSMVLMGTCYAANELPTATSCTSDTDCKTTVGEKCIEGACFKPIDLLLFREETSTVADLPEVTLEGALKTVIKTILGTAMLLRIAAIVVAAIFYILSRGNEEETSKAKNIILYLVIGMVIMAAAYGLVAGVVQFDFFKAK